ncbi:MAG TPA: SDR family NAD(P)-dependent oxidoreductase [Longimicrobiales bacterium]
MSLWGSVALVTGATSGIGYHTANGLARLGARVYITGRDPVRGEQAARQMCASAGHGGVEFIRADASTVGGNQQLARQVRSETDRLHVLINNVGGAYNDRRETADGYEATLAMHLIGPFALTDTLLPLLESGTPSRIVNVVSAAVGTWRGDPFEDLQSLRSYLGSRAYARSKLLNLLWTAALARRVRGTDIVVNAVDPGTAWTPMTAGIEPRSVPVWVSLIWPAFRWAQQRRSAEEAAYSSLLVATAPEAGRLHGAYVGSRGEPARAPAAVFDPKLQERTWSIAQQLVAYAPTALALSEVPS